jgi:hypothetical protein
MDPPQCGQAIVASCIGASFRRHRMPILTMAARDDQASAASRGRCRLRELICRQAFGMIRQRGVSRMSAAGSTGAGGNRE